MTTLAGAMRGCRFANVNKPGSAGFRRGWQKHHVLPRQLFACGGLGVMMSALGGAGLWFDDFAANGVLLPGTEAAAIDERLPLHRGPHRTYNELVIERVGTVEMEWSRTRSRDELQARDAALSRIRLIQRGLKRRLRGGGKLPILLNRRDPIGRGVDFANLDAMADELWSASSGKA